MPVPDPQMSRVVFGSEYRLGFLYAIATAKADELYGTFIGDQCGLGTRAGEELRKLAELGLLKKLDPVKGQRRIFYERRESPLWDAVVQIVGP